MIVYDKEEIKDYITIENVYTLLQEFGGEPEYTNFGIISHTICHNPPKEGSRKLYFYENTKLFNCFTNCGFFDVFDLVKKVKIIQEDRNFDLNDAVRWLAQRFNIAGREEDDDVDQLKDWKYLSNYNRIQNIEIKNNSVTLKEYDSEILNRFNYNVLIQPWIDEGISQESLKLAQIGYYPGNEQITIPHFDENNRLIGIRGRTLVQEEAEKYGKYRPIQVCGNMYNHPLGLSLYGLNWAKENIKNIHSVFIFESEKSVLKYMSMFGIENDIAVACCGSNLSNTQINLLLNLGVEEIIIALDRQYQEIGDDEYKKWVKKLTTISKNYSNYVKISFMFDIDHVISYKSSPIDEGKEKFLYLYKNRLDQNGRMFG